MSHFNVLVPAESKEELGHILLPYHEYECTGIEEYIQFVPVDEDEKASCLQDYAESSEENFAKFAKEWGGFVVQEGELGRMTNPNSRWDSWCIGGRWSNFFLCYDGEKRDVATVGEIDWNSMREDRAGRMRKDFVRFRNSLQIAGATPEDFYNSTMDKDAWMKFRPAIQEAAIKEPDKYMDDLEVIIVGGDFDGILTGEEAHDEFYKRALTFAFLDLRGVWHERATMGFFAVTRDENDGYNDEFWTFVDNLEEEKPVYIVDCHI